MKTLPVNIQDYFHAAIDGHPGLLPPTRASNREFLGWVNKALLKEDSYTEQDCAHLRILMLLADSVTLKMFDDTRSFIALESSLLALQLEINPKALRYGLEYLLFLLARHGQVSVNLETLRIELRMWRSVVRGFKASEQPFVSGYVNWLREQAFSPLSIQRHVAELARFNSWMQRKGFESFEALPVYDLYRYFQTRSAKATTQSKGWHDLKPMFHYYKATVDGNFNIPALCFSVSATPAGASTSVSSGDINRLWEALVSGILPDEGALMLLLIVGLGLPLKALPRLRLIDRQGGLTYTEYRPRRQGRWERLVSLPTEEPWVQAMLTRYWVSCPSGEDSPYLFQTSSSVRRKRPVSVEYCQRLVQDCVAEVLEYPIPVNSLERGALKALARQTELMDFMAHTQAVPVGKQTRMMTWLMANRCILVN